MANPQWWPVDNVRISAEFGADAAWYRANVGQLGHNGIDLPGSHRTPIYATDDGVVHIEGWNTAWSGVAGGISVILRHSWGYSGYAHLDETIINVGQSVSRGQLIGYMGATGLVTGTHLHFETLPLSVNWGNGYSGRVNPRSIINLQPRGNTSGGSTPTPSTGKATDMAFESIRRPDGTITFVDELGIEGIDSYRTPDIGAAEYLSAFSKVFGGWQEVSAREFDIARAIADRRRAAIEKRQSDLVLSSLRTQNEAAIKSALEAALKNGVKLDAAQLAKDVAKTVNDDIAKRMKD